MTSRECCDAQSRISTFGKADAAAARCLRLRPRVFMARLPLRRPNAELRPREHLTEREVDKLIAAAKGNHRIGR
jgi:hypothetical protein